MDITMEEVGWVIDRYTRGVYGSAAVMTEDWYRDEIARAIFEGCARHKVEVVLALAQGVVESHFGTAPMAKRSRRTRNIYNVGNVDSGANEGQASWTAGIERYCRLMAREYNWCPGGMVTLEMMVSHDFMRPRGGRYASARNYTGMVATIGKRIIKEIEDGR